jgi:hypothetical protein
MPSPPFQTEKITISGTGALSFTVGQRASASLNLSIEKLVISPSIKYFNFRKPEPSSWWGWVQTVSRDFIIQDYELQYRRQLLLAKERNYYRAIEEIRCLIIAAERHTTDEVKFYATDSEADPIELAAELAEKVVNEVYSVEQWDSFLAANAGPTEIPLWVEDGIYYEIDEPYGALVTIRWQDFGIQCPVLPPPVIVPGPSSPSKDESRPGGGGGGGSQPQTPTPPGRGKIDNSDSDGPPPSSSFGPPSPDVPPLTGSTTIVWGAGSYFNDNGCDTSDFGPVSSTIPYIVPVGDISVGVSVGSSVGTFCGVTDQKNYSVYLSVAGAGVGLSYGPAKFNVLPTIISVTYGP